MAAVSLETAFAAALAAAAFGPADIGPTPMFCMARASSRCRLARASTGSLRRAGSGGARGGAFGRTAPEPAPSEDISNTSPAGSARPRRRSAARTARAWSRESPGAARISFAVAAAASFRTAAASGSVQEKDDSSSAYAEPSATAPSAWASADWTSDAACGEASASTTARSGATSTLPAHSGTGAFTLNRKAPSTSPAMSDT